MRQFSGTVKSSGSVSCEDNVDAAGPHGLLEPSAGWPWNDSSPYSGSPGVSLSNPANSTPSYPLAVFGTAISDCKTESNKSPTIFAPSTIFGIQKLTFLDSPKLLYISTFLNIKFKILPVNK